MDKQAHPGSTRQLLILIISFQLLMYHLWGLDPQKTVDQYLQDQWKMVDGIPSNTIKIINQTPDGYLWIGTSNGLVRFDGVKFVVVPFAEKEEFYLKEIRQLFVDRKGNLWIGTSVGLTVYYSSKNRYKTFTVTDGITGDGIRHIKDDMKGNTWIGFTSSYVNRFSDGEFTTFDESHGLLGKKVNAVVEDRQGVLLFGTRENGIFTFKDGTFSKYPVQGLENTPINTIYEDRAGDLWIGTLSNGLIRQKRVTGAEDEVEIYTSDHGLTHNHINYITEDSEGNLWAATGGGLNRIKKKQDGTLAFGSLLKDFDITFVFEDSEKSLWAGTNNSGLIRLKDGKIMPYTPFEAYPYEIPFSIFEDRHGDTWIGTVSGKLLRFRGGDLIASEAIPELSGFGIAAIAEDADGNLWLGTNGKGAFQMKNGRCVRFTTAEGLADNLVTSIYRDSRDNLWFSTFDGVSVRRTADGIVESLDSGGGLSGKVAHNVYEDKAHNIWIAADKGITVLKGGKISRQDMSFYLRGDSVSCIYQDPSNTDEGGGIFWVSTDGAGLKRLSIKDGTITSITSYTTAQGMASNFLYQFLEDSRGNFWLMSKSGILRVAKSELNRLADGDEDTINCTSFGISDGMKSLEFNNERSRSSALKAGNGEFRFITRKGISVVNPEKIALNKTPPPLVIETVYFNRRSIPFHPDAAPVTGKGIRDLSFHFTAPTFLSPEKTKFKYRLEGIDREWIFLLPGQERAAYYKDPAPGTYTFRVNACNAEGVWNPTGAVLTFTLEPLFYQTLLFKISVLLLIAALAAAVFYLRKKKKPLFEKKAKYKGAPLNAHFAEECITKLNYLMEIEKVYCDSDITLQSLAEKMSIAPHQLSQLLSEKMDRHFADYINWYRVEEVKKILQTPGGARRKISAAAFEVGFSTMAAFYKAFKKHTGMTPTEYKKRGKGVEG
jgi:ligand-binding sensor domain-containing protein/AraC-like DNA-binding protein